MEIVPLLVEKGDEEGVSISTERREAGKGKKTKSRAAGFKLFYPGVEGREMAKVSSWTRVLFMMSWRWKVCQIEFEVTN